MKLVLSLTLLILLWIVAYLYLRTRQGLFTNKLSEYATWMKSNLDSMFYQLKERTARKLILTLMVGAGVLGFFLPGKFSEIDKVSSIKRAIDLNRKADYKEAALILEDLKKLDSPIVHNELGVAYLGMDNYDWAEKEFKQAIKVLPHYGKAHYNLATVYSRLGKNMDASFEVKKTKESSKYTISEEDLYRLSGSFWDNLLLRLLLTGIMAYLGYRLPRVIVNFLKRRRIKKYDDQLADALIMASNGLRAGFSLLQALEMVSKEARPPVSQEFGLILKEHQLGSDLDEALTHLAERMPTLDSRIFVNSILILRETGGNLTEIFDIIAQTIQERQRVQKKIKTMTAEGETQAVILCILPIVLGLILDTLSPEVFSLMYTTFLGWLLIILMALMEGAGLYWMLKIVRVKV